jgi:hypothetical protein
LHVKIPDAVEHRGVVLGWNCRDPGHPGQQIGFERFQQLLVLIKFGIAEALDMRIGKPAHDQIGLAGAAMPGPEQQPPPAGVEAVARSGAAGHEFSNAKNPAGAGRGFYIERAGADVSG